MTVYNKLKIAILTILSSPHLYAITLDPLQIQSAPGELLYAEMSFQQANPNDKIEVSLANPEDLMMIGAAHHPPASLNFFTRRNGQGEGTIVITSNRPMTDSELNIIVKIREGNATHLKHIKQSVHQNNKAQSALGKSSHEKSLTPKFIVSEKDIALNLPESTRFSSPPAMATSNKPVELKQERVLKVSSTPPPALNLTAAKTVIATSAPAPVTVATPQPAPSTVTTNLTLKETRTVASTQTPSAIHVVQPNVVAATKPVAVPSSPTASATDMPTGTEKAPVPNKAAPVAEVVTQVARPLKTPDSMIVPQPVKTVEADIQAHKAETPPPLQAKTDKKATPAQVTQKNTPMQQHVVQRNESLWSIAQQISASTQQPVTQVMKQIKQQNEHAFVAGNANRLRQSARLNFSLNTAPSRPDQAINQLAAKTTTPASGKVKYRLQQAEMSLVAESNQDSSTGTAKKDTLQQKTNADLSLKVMTAREKTVTLQRNVTQLELALSQKEQRIQLLNARLAELQNQLKAQQETRNPAH